MGKKYNTEKYQIKVNSKNMMWLQKPYVTKLETIIFKTHMTTNAHKNLEYQIINKLIKKTPYSKNNKKMII